MRSAKGVAAAAVAVIAVAGAVAWTRSAYEAGMAQALAELTESGRGALKVERQVSGNLFVTQQERVDLTVELDPVNGEAVQFSLRSRVFFLPAFVTGSLRLETTFIGQENAFASASLEVGEDGGRWRFNALTGNSHLHYRSASLTLKPADETPVEMTLQPFELEVDVDGGAGGFRYSARWPGLEATLPQAGSFTIGGMAWEGDGEFGGDTERQRFEGTMGGVEMRSPVGEFALGEVRMSGEQVVSNGLMDASATVRGGAVSSRSPLLQLNIDGFDIDYSVARLHYESYQELVLAGQTESSETPAQVQAALLRLASHGPAIAIERLTLRHDGTESWLKGRVEVARPDQPFTQMEQATAQLDAEFELDISDKLFGSRELAAMLLAGPIGQGLLTHDERGRITLRATVVDGTLTLNGVSRPL
jgi:hypothetical protein